MKTPQLILSALMAASSCECGAQTVYARQHDMLVQAIRSGHAEGVMTGDTAELFRRQFKSDGTLLVRVDVLQNFNRPDCKRLRVVYTKKDVLSTKGPQDLTMNMKLNYCLDGRPPTGLEVQQ